MRRPRRSRPRVLGWASAALSALTLATSLSRSSPSWAEAPPLPSLPAARGVVKPKPVTFGIARILELAERNHPNVAQARARLAHVRFQLDEARFAPFSMFKMQGGVAIVPALRGNNVFTPNTDTALNSGLGMAWRVSLDGVVPLWTFGKITSLWSAAEANVKVHEASIEKERDQVRLDVRRAYFGYLLTREAMLLLDDVKGQLADGEKKLEEAIEKGEGDPIDLLKLQTYKAELEVRESEAKRFQKVALAALRFFTGLKELPTIDGELKPPKHVLLPVVRYLTAARLYRPEVQMAKHGVDARRAQVELARARLFPDLGLGLNIAYGSAPTIANQLNPYVLDPANFFGFSIGAVFQWNLDFMPGVARVRQAEAQLEEMRSLERFALGGVGVEVEEAHAECVDWQRRVEAYAKATKNAKKWLITVQQGIDVGTVEEKDLLEPAKAYALNKFQQMNATMELDLAMSRLAKATGWDAIAPE
jgi:outer membrane protein TolC